MRKVMHGIAIIALVGIAFQTSFAATPWLHVDGNQIKDPLGNKVVLHGVSLQAISNINVPMVLDLVTNTADKASSSPGWYTRIVRMPNLGNGGNYTQYNQTTLKPAIDYATSKGLYAIIDLHYVDNTDAHVADVNNFWTTIAPLYKDYSNVIFEPYNEPINQSQSWSQFKPTMQAWVDLIRKYAPNNLIFVGSPIWSQEMGGAAADPLTGSNIVYVVHMYSSHFATQWNRDQVRQCAAARPMVCTEWGFRAGLNWGPNETASGYGKGILNWFDTLGLSWTAWCADDSWEPIMFNNGNPWTLRVGEGEMGGFVKDWLYTYRDSSQPSAGTPANFETKPASGRSLVIIQEHGSTLNVIMPKEDRYRVQITGLDGKVYLSSSGQGISLLLHTGSLAKGVYAIRVVGDKSLSLAQQTWINN
jgi:endoglucanase